jgi:hypothetical protein
MRAIRNAVTSKAARESVKTKTPPKIGGVSMESMESRSGF